MFLVPFYLFIILIYYFYLIGYNIYKFIYVYIYILCIYKHIYIYILICIYIYVIYIYIHKSNWNMKSFFSEILNFPFRKFWASYILDRAQTVWALQMLLQKSSLIFWMKKLWAPENHVLVNMLLCSSHFTKVH